MVWARFDDNFADDPVLVRATGDGFRAYVDGILYVARHTTDGHIPAEALNRRDQRRADELCGLGLWTAEPGGWYAPRWAEHVPSRAKIEQRRKADAERMRRSRSRKGDAPG